MNRKLPNKGLLFLCCIVILGLCFSCKSNKAMIAKDIADFKMLDSLLNKDKYSIEIHEVYPFNTAATMQVLNSALFQTTGNNSSRITVRGDGNFIKIKNDSVKGYVPFFGERRLNAGSYNGTDTAIQFDGIGDNFEKTINKDKKRLEIKFTANHKGPDSEIYKVNVTIFPNNNVEVNVYPTYRTFIRYRGIVVSDTSTSKI